MKVSRVTVKSLLGYVLPVAAVAAVWFWYYRVPPKLEMNAIAVISVQGDTVAVSRLHDGALLVNFYASWCGHCLSELPALQRAHELGVYTVVGVTDDSDAQIAAIRERYGIHFPLYRLEHSIRHYGVISLPTSYLINDQGEVVSSITGTRQWDSDTFMNKMKALLSKQ